MMRTSRLLDRSSFKSARKHYLSGGHGVSYDVNRYQKPSAEGDIVGILYIAWEECAPYLATVLLTRKPVRKELFLGVLKT